MSITTHSVTVMPAIQVDARGLPRRHWAGRTEAVKVLRQLFTAIEHGHLSQDEATDWVEDILQAYLKEQR